MKIIGRISKKGNEYYQTAIKVEGQEESKFIPVFLKKGINKLNFKTKETKLDKAGVAYSLYEVEDKNVFMPVDETTKQVERAIITK